MRGIGCRAFLIATLGPASDATRYDAAVRGSLGGHSCRTVLSEPRLGSGLLGSGPTPAPWRSAYWGRRLRHPPSLLHAQNERRRRVTIVPGHTGALRQCVDSVDADRWGIHPERCSVEPWPGWVLPIPPAAGAVALRAPRVVLGPHGTAAVPSGSRSSRRASRLCCTITSSPRTRSWMSRCRAWWKAIVA